MSRHGAVMLQGGQGLLDAGEGVRQVACVLCVQGAAVRRFVGQPGKVPGHALDIADRVGPVGHDIAGPADRCAAVMLDDLQAQLRRVPHRWRNV